MSDTRLNKLEDDVGEIKTDVGILKRDVMSQIHLSDSFSNAIEKIQEAIGVMTTMIRLHEQAAEHNKTTDKLKEDGIDKSITNLTKRIDSVDTKLDTLVTFKDNSKKWIYIICGGFVVIGIISSAGHVNLFELVTKFLFG